MYIMHLLFMYDVKEGMGEKQIYALALYLEKKSK